MPDNHVSIRSPFRRRLCFAEGNRQDDSFCCLLFGAFVISGCYFALAQRRGERLVESRCTRLCEDGTISPMRVIVLVFTRLLPIFIVRRSFLSLITCLFRGTAWYLNLIAIGQRSGTSNFTENMYLKGNRLFYYGIWSNNIRSWQ